LNPEASPTYSSEQETNVRARYIGIQHAATINSLNAEFGQKMTHLAKLNWGIELKFEASPTAPSKKQMSEQDIGNQHEATNSLNAEPGQKDSTQRILGFQNFVRKPTTCYYSVLLTVGNSYPTYVSIQIVQYYLQQPAGYLQLQIQVPSTCHKNPSAPPKIIKTRRPHPDQAVGESYSQKKSDKESTTPMDGTV